MRRLALTVAATVMLGGAFGLSAGITPSGHTAQLLPPPGCTDGWNTDQSADNANAPNHTSPGCTNPHHKNPPAPPG